MAELERRISRDPLESMNLQSMRRIAVLQSFVIAHIDGNPSTMNGQMTFAALVRPLDGWIVYGDGNIQKSRGDRKWRLVHAAFSLNNKRDHINSLNKISMDYSISVSQDRFDT